MSYVYCYDCRMHMVVKFLSRLGNNGRKRYQGASWDYFMGPKARRARTFLQAQNHTISGDVKIVELRETKKNFAKVKTML